MSQFRFLNLYELQEKLYDIVSESTPDIEKILDIMKIIIEKYHKPPLLTAHIYKLMQNDDNIDILRIINTHQELRSFRGDYDESLVFYSSSLRMARFLVEDLRLNINHQDEYGQTVLHTVNDLPILKYYLDSGIGVNIQDESGYTALMVASHDCNLQKVKLLLEYNTDPDIKGNRDENALILPSLCDEDRSISILHSILESGADPNITDINLNTPIFYYTSPRIVKLLLHYGSNPNHKNNAGITPIVYNIEYCLMKDSLDYIHTMVSAGVVLQEEIDGENFFEHLNSAKDYYTQNPPDDISIGTQEHLSLIDRMRRNIQIITDRYYTQLRPSYKTIRGQNRPYSSMVRKRV